MTVCAALLAGLAIYLEYPIVRGALVGAAPGIVNRNIRTLILGMLCGSLGDCAAEFFWMWGGLTWDRRKFDCPALQFCLPPFQDAVNPGDDPRNSFVTGLLMWVYTQWGIWILIWPKPLRSRRVAVLTCLVCGFAACGVLLSITTAVESGRIVRHGLPMVLQTAAVLAVMPASCLVVLFTCRQSEVNKTPESATGACRQSATAIGHNPAVTERPTSRPPNH